MDGLALGAAVALCVIWIGYPLVIALIAMIRRVPPAPADGDAPPVTVVLASRESPPTIRDRVDNLLATAYPADRLSIVVAVDAAADPERVMAALPAGKRVAVVRADPPGGKATALNAGVRAATGEIIVFADTHQRFDAETIPRLVSALADPAVGAVSGSLRLPSHARSLVARYWTFERWLRRMEARVHSSVGATGAVYAIRRELWRPLPANLLLDDVYTPMQIVLQGRRVTFDEQAVALDTRSPSPAQEYVRKVRTLTGVVQLAAWLPALLIPVRNPIWIQFLFHKVFRLLTPYLLLTVGVWAGLRAVALLEPVGAGGRFFLAALLTMSVLWVVRAPAALARRIRTRLTEAVLLQKAIIVAGLNALRGRWQVWDV